MPINADNNEIPMSDAESDEIVPDQIRLRTHKVILLGDAGVGKTCLFRRFMGESFPKSTATTLMTQASFPRRFQDGQGQPVEVDIWDTAGAERMRSITETYYRQTSAALMVYDIDNAETLDSIVSHWAFSIQSREQNAKLFLVGNKLDLVDEGDGEDTILQAEKYTVESQDVEIEQHFQVSAKSDAGVEEMFHKIAKFLDMKNRGKRTKSTIQLPIKEEICDGNPKTFSIIEWLRSKCQ
ncbi:ras-related protein Rab-13-like [Saccoglossus kowalevskii]|uniref:Ras-related protein Rab-13-like n=1 Tax=Saccoglossus kowalevskii TaxID=10224 RepID=A0ABM0H0T7_SACKO|nr:PREDICTED: ras-related protein Rab-13-like [Saccoglossus kowalevskii]